jgi:hypothetical protein
VTRADVLGLQVLQLTVDVVSVTHGAATQHTVSCLATQDIQLVA